MLESVHHCARVHHVAAGGAAQATRNRAATRSSEILVAHGRPYPPTSMAQSDRLLTDAQPSPGARARTSHVGRLRLNADGRHRPRCGQTNAIQQIDRQPGGSGRSIIVARIQASHFSRLCLGLSAHNDRYHERVSQSDETFTPRRAVEERWALIVQGQSAPDSKQRGLRLRWPSQLARSATLSVPAHPIRERPLLGLVPLARRCTGTDVATAPATGVAGVSASAGPGKFYTARSSRR